MYLSLLQALDVLFQKMKVAGFPFGRVVAMSGCGQQHGSVYWKEGSENALKNLDSQQSLEALLKVRM
jgi:xylulokinase